MQKTVIIDSQFNGPANSANGGYACGIMAEAFDHKAAVKVSLKAPPLLDAPLELIGDGQQASLQSGDKVFGKAELGHLDISQIPPCPSITEVTAAEAHPFDSPYSVLRQCFVCGPDRAEPNKHGGGLRIHVGAIESKQGEAASFWQLDEAWANDEGNIDHRYIWSALDCPGYFASAGGKPALLGSMTTQIFKPLPKGGRAIIHAWTNDKNPNEGGRKRLAGTALYSESGDLIAASEAVWVLVSEDFFDQLAIG